MRSAASGTVDIFPAQMVFMTQPLAVWLAVVTAGTTSRSDLLRSGSSAAATRVSTAHAMMYTIMESICGVAGG